MNTSNASPLPALAMAVLLTLLAASTARAADSNPPSKMTFQGFLTDAGTPPVPLGNASPVNKEIGFAIYDNATGGTVKWAEAQIVTLDKGHFSVLLGEGSSSGSHPHPDLHTVFAGADASDRWLGITVDSAEIAPRIQFFAAPYAQLARAANSLVGEAETGSLNATGDIAAAGLISSSGSSSGLAFEDRTDGGTPWQWYSDAGSAHLWHGADKISVSDSGVLSASGLSVSGQATLTGNVGIGTTSPPQQLSLTGGIGFANHNGADKKLYSPADGTLEWMTHDASATHGFAVSHQGTQRVFLNSNGNSYFNGGNVGIGTTSPRVPLDVNGSVNHVRQYGFLNRSAPTGIANTDVNAPYTIFASRYIGAEEFNAFSDARIKSIVGFSDNRQDLETIQKLRVTDYRMVDVVAEGNVLKKGFIAQEVAAVIPEAVTSAQRFIPDIYSHPSAFQFNERRQTLAVTLPKPHGLKAGDRVRIIADESQLDLTVTDAPSATEFVVGKVEEAPKETFIFGKEVPDFRILNYDRIFTTGIGAIQELARQVESLKANEARIAELEQKTARMAELEVKASRVDSLEREVAELKRLVAGLAQRSTEQRPVRNLAAAEGR